MPFVGGLTMLKKRFSPSGSLPDNVKAADASSCTCTTSGSAVAMTSLELALSRLPSEARTT